MIEKQLMSHDGIELTYAVTDLKQDKPWIALIIPFGFTVKMAQAFFEFFQGHYNIVVWESRSILEDSDRGVSDNEFDISNHVADMLLILDECGAEQYIAVGYCSGAGLALAAANLKPQLFGQLLLVHGEFAMVDEPSCTSMFAAEIDSLLSLAAGSEKALGMIFSKVSEAKVDADTDTDRPKGLDLAFSRLAFLRRYAANYVAYKDADFKNMASVVSHRCLLMAGERDIQTNVASCETMADLLVNASIHVDPQADHYGILREESDTLVTIWNYLCEQQPQASLN